MPNILIVDDDPDIIKANRKYLTVKGYHVYTADCGEMTIESLKTNTFECIVLDVLLPDTNGFALCREIRTLSAAPIIFLSCKDGEEDKIRGLMSGGDDYMTKPFSMKELAARIHAQIRRSNLKRITIDRQNYVITVNGKSIFLTQLEFALFILLYENPEMVFSSQQLYVKLWNADVKNEANTIRVYIKRLREKLSIVEDVIGNIENVYGKGYRFCPLEKDVE